MVKGDDLRWPDRSLGANDDGRLRSLDAHLNAVADLAGSFAAPFGLAEPARYGRAPLIAGDALPPERSIGLAAIRAAGFGMAFQRVAPVPAAPQVRNGTAAFPGAVNDHSPE